MTATSASISRSTPPPAVLKIMNAVVTFMVGRGWGAASERLMILHWTGRKTGLSYSTPVSRFELNGTIFTKTRAPYKANFRGGGPAELVLDGTRSAFIGTAIEDAHVVASRMRRVLDDLGPSKGARALGLRIEGDPTVEELAAFAAADGLVVIDFEPAAE